MGSLHSLDSANACGLEEELWGHNSPNSNRSLKLSKTFQKYVESLDWNDYRQWLYNNKSKFYAKTLLKKGKDCYKLAFSNELVDIPNTRTKEDILRAITNLTRYIDIKYDTYFHDDYLLWLKRKEIKWKASRPIVIQKEIPLETILSNIQKLSPKYKLFGIFALVSGLRTFEAVEALNNHDKICNNGILEMYWDRKTKKANAVYCHPLLHDKIEFKYTKNTVHRNINSHNLGCEIRYLRKINYTVIATKLDPLLAEFMQGRRGNVSQRHYFLPMMSNHRKKWERIWKLILKNSRYP